MANSNIPLAGASIDTATPINNAAQAQTTNALATEKLLQEHFQTMSDREKSRLTSTVSGAVQLKSYLDNNDLDGAHNFLLKRREALHNRMASGENIDTEETDYALDALRRGNVDQLKNDISGLMAAGQVYGILNNKDMPSNIQEWQYYNSLSPEDQQRYLTMKRSNQTVNLGGSQMVVGPTGQPVANYEVTPKPEDQPRFKKEQAQATAEGTAQGQRNADTQKKLIESVATQNYLNKVMQLLPNATSGGLSTDAKGVKSYMGISTPSSQTDRQIEIIAAKLVANVPRFEGPQSDMDTKMYKDAAGDLANTKLPKEDRLAAAEMMINLLDEYGPQGTGNVSATPDVAAGQKRRIWNPATGKFE